MEIGNCYKFFDINNKIKDCLTLVKKGNFLITFLGYLPGGNIYMRLNLQPELVFLFCSTLMNRSVFYIKTNRYILFVICSQTDLIKC